jgi:hypothetical protein
MVADDVNQAIRMVAVKYPLVQIAKRGQWWYATVWVDLSERTEMATDLLVALNRLLGR